MKLDGVEEDIRALLHKLNLLRSKAATPADKADVGWLTWVLVDGARQILDTNKESLIPEIPFVGEVYHEGKVGSVTLRASDSHFRISPSADVRYLESIVGSDVYADLFETVTDTRLRRGAGDLIMNLPADQRSAILSVLTQEDMTPPILFHPKKAT